MILGLGLSACSSASLGHAATTSPGGHQTSPSSGAEVSSSPTSSFSVAAVPVDLTRPCTVLSAVDFAGVGVTVDGGGEDVSRNFNLATTASVACQWTNFNNNTGTSGSWELIIGTGDAASAYKSDRSLADLDKVKDPQLGDEAYLADKVSQLDATDHDFEIGVRHGDTYFTLSTTANDGGTAVTALAKIVENHIAAGS